jgi:hypothetical protein
MYCKKHASISKWLPSKSPTVPLIKTKLQIVLRKHVTIMELFAYNCCQIDPTQVNYTTDQQLHSSFGVKIVGIEAANVKAFR